MKKKLFFLFVLSAILLLSKSYGQKNVQVQIDSLEKVLKTESQDTNRIKTLLQLCSQYQQTDPSKLKTYLPETVNLANTLAIPKWIAEATYTAGLSEYSKGNFAPAKKKYEEALKIFVQEKNQTRMATMTYNIGVIEVFTGDYAQANQKFFDALKIYETLGKKDLMSNAYTAIGNVYGRQGNEKKELEFHLKSLTIRKDLKDDTGIAASYINIGNTYGRRQIYDTALIYYFKGLKIAEQIKNRKWIFNSLGNIGTIYAEQKKYKDALAYLSKGLDMAENIGDKKSISTFLNSIGQLYFDMNDMKNAKAYYLKGLALDIETGNKEEMKTSYYNLSKMENISGNYKDAYDYRVLYGNVKDSMLNEESSRQMNEMQAKYDSEKQEQQIELLNKNNEIQIAKSKQQQIIIWATGAGLFVVLILAFFILKQFKQKQKANLALESAYIQIEEKNTSITDSINYAKRIQTAILPSLENIQNSLSKAFVLYKPKDIVSGDFYWFTEKNGYSILAVADCTGHGVPGAFMSMIGNDLLTQIIIEKGINQPNLILTQLHEGVKTALKQDDRQSEAKDGMDIAIVKCISGNGIVELEYSGALRPFWLVKNGEKELQEIKPDKHSIGGSYSNDQRLFTNHSLTLSKGDTFYLTTDGYADQFGGELGKKMMTKNMKELILSIQQSNMGEQKIALENSFKNWQLNREQIDDVLVIGVRV